MSFIKSFSISAVGGNSLKHLFEINSFGLILITASNKLSGTLFLAFVLAEATGENILSKKKKKKALLNGIIRHLKTKVPHFLKTRC